MGELLTDEGEDDFPTEGTPSGGSAGKGWSRRREPSCKRAHPYSTHGAKAGGGLLATRIDCGVCSLATAAEEG